MAADGKGREGLKRNLPSQAGGRVQLVEPPPLGIKGSRQEKKRSFYGQADRKG